MVEQELDHIGATHRRMANQGRSPEAVLFRFNVRPACQQERRNRHIGVVKWSEPGSVARSWIGFRVKQNLGNGSWQIMLEEK